jgi:hypothetical protein
VSGALERAANPAEVILRLREKLAG